MQSGMIGTGFVGMPMKNFNNFPANQQMMMQPPMGMGMQPGMQQGMMQPQMGMNPPQMGGNMRGPFPKFGQQS